MDLKQYLNDVDKEYLYNDGTISEFTDINQLKSNSLIINDTSIDKVYAYNRNFTVLHNELMKKANKASTYYSTSIECDAPSGYILAVDGPGQVPYWVDPISFKQSMKVEESENIEKVSINYNTLNPDLFSSVVGMTLGSEITVTDNNNTLILTPMEIPVTVSYRFKTRIKPNLLTVLSYSSDYVLFDGTSIDITNKIVVVTESGLVELEVKSTEVIDNTTKIYTFNNFGTIYKCFSFKLEVNADIYDNSDVNLKRIYIEDIILVDNDLYLNYYLKECSGSNLTFQLNSTTGIIIRYIDIELITI